MKNRNSIISTLLILPLLITSLFSFEISETITVPSGSFDIGGNPPAHTWPLPIHQVTFTHDMELAKYTVTNQNYVDMLNYAMDESLIEVSNDFVINLDGDQQELIIFDSPTWGAICEISYSYGIQTFIVDDGKENRPTSMVTWYGAAFYCNMISKQAGFTELYDLETWECEEYSDESYRLPTEYEWEYAARYNDGRRYVWGNQVPNPSLANYYLNVGTTTDVGSYSPEGDTELGFCDMAGNVWEFTNDWFQDHYNSYPETNPTGPDTGDHKVMRGGSFSSPDNYMWACRRAWVDRDYEDDSNGFRFMKTSSLLNNIENNYELSIMNYELKQNYPNPFNPVTKINYELRISNYELAEIVVYNSVGQNVWSSIVGAKNLSPGTSATPTHGSIQFDGTNLNSGIYYYSLVIDGKKMDTKSMILVK